MGQPVRLLNYRSLSLPALLALTVLVIFLATPEGEILGHYNAEDFVERLQKMLDDGSFRATEEGVWVNHEDVNPATGEVEDKQFWLVEHDGLVFGSGWRHDEPGS